MLDLNLFAKKKGFQNKVRNPRSWWTKEIAALLKERDRWRSISRKTGMGEDHKHRFTPTLLFNKFQSEKTNGESEERSQDITLIK